jgi:hypothetical protein
MTLEFNTSLNWFTLNTNKNGVKLSYEQFIENVNNQIHNKLTKTKDNKLCNEQYLLEDTKIVLERNKYELLQNNSAEYYPILTFHATSNINKINSIVKYGYLLPGDTHPLEGYTLKMAHGAVYGDGIYTTSNFATEEWYTFFDKNSYVQLIVNIVFLGKIYNIETGNYRYSYSEYIINNKYRDGSDTRSLNNDVFISANTSNVIPIAILKLKPCIDHSKMKQYFQFTRNGVLHDDTCLYPYEYYINDSRTVNLYKIFDDTYVVVKPYFDKYVESNICHFVSVPLIKHTQKNINCFDNFINSLNGTKYCSLYNTKAEFYKITSTSNFKSKCNEFKLENKTDIFDQFDKILNYIENSDSNQINVVYLFVQTTYDEYFTVELNAFIAKHYDYIKLKTIIIKLIYMNDQINPTIMSGLNFLKYHFQKESIYEQFAHYVTKDNNLEMVTDFLVDEQNNISRNHVNYSIPFPLGQTGEGFVKNLDEQPFWDVKTSTSHTLYKGSYIPSIKIDGQYYKTMFYDKDIKDLEKDRELNKKLHEEQEKRLTKKVAKNKLINCIKVKEVGIEDTSKNISEYFCEIIVQLLSKLRNYIMIYPERIKLFEPITSLLCQKVIDKLPDLNVSNGKTIFYQICTMMNEIKTFTKYVR